MVYVYKTLLTICIQQITLFPTLNFLEFKSSVYASKDKEMMRIQITLKINALISGILK